MANILTRRFLVYLWLGVFSLARAPAETSAPSHQWTVEQANRWYRAQPWMTGANFIPSTAVNQLEMWQADTFDPATIDRELGWAEGIGFNTARVFLHSLAWGQDPGGFILRVERFLAIADSHHIRPILVIFDDCWNPHPQPGPQPQPRTGVHNSGWMQDPGDPQSYIPANFPELERYVKAVLTHFSHDRRILFWDLYNEPGNSKKGDKSLDLLEHVFSWSDAVRPAQPVTVGYWNPKLTALNEVQLKYSDINSYHDYRPADEHLALIRTLRSGGRPLVCTEYMARLRESRFSNILPMLKAENVWAINWGLVAGKTNTIYAWDTPLPNGAEPKEWFHDIFHRDGTPYRVDEEQLIRRLNDRVGIANATLH